jgi:Flp pilus assembly protein TadD
MMDDPVTRSLLDRATALLGAGRVQDAVDAHVRLLARQPELPDSWYNLGYLYQQVRRFDDALQAYGQAGGSARQPGRRSGRPSGPARRG